MIDYEQVFRDSFLRAVGNSSYNADFIGEFYRIFFTKSDDVARLFANTNMSAQKTMLHDSLETLVEFYTTRKLTQQLQHLGKVHGSRGHAVPLYLFDQWEDSLMEALQSFDKDYSEDVELAWRLVLAPGITYIKFVSSH